MKAWDKGPAGLLGPDDGVSYWQPQPTGGWVTLKFVPATFPHDAAACGVQAIPPGGRIPLQAHRAAEKLLYVLDGSGSASVDGALHRLTPGTTVAMCRKVPHEVTNNGDQDLRLFFWVTPPGYEYVLAWSGRPRRASETAPQPFAAPAAGHETIFPSPLLIDGDAVAASWAADKGQSIVVGPADGESFWQAPPAGGYIQYKVDPLHFASNRFFAAVQILPPGGMTPPHAHTRNEEILLIANGSGEICVDGVWHEAVKGSLAFVSRWVTHSIRNTGDTDMAIFAVFTPPGLEQSLRAVSRPRVPGESEPDPATFTLPDNLAEVLDGSTLSLPEHAEAHNRNALVPPRPALGAE